MQALHSRVPTAGPGGTATFETGFSCTPLSPLLVNASGLALRGIQFNYQTPYTMGANLNRPIPIDAFDVRASRLRHLAGPAFGVVSELQQPHFASPPRARRTATLVPFPDFGRNSSYAATAGMSAYHSLQTKVEKQFANGLNFLFTYTCSRRP